MVRDTRRHLQPFIVTPTFLKDFGYAHLLSVWNKAYEELAEAEEITFIGYSLPEADYHFRALLLRAIKPEAKIISVLAENDDSKKGTPKKYKRFHAAERYRSFFGPERVKIDLSRVEGFFSEELMKTSFQAKTRRLKRRLKKLGNA